MVTTYGFSCVVSDCVVSARVAAAVGGQVVAFWPSGYSPGVDSTVCDLTLPFSGKLYKLLLAQFVDARRDCIDRNTKISRNLCIGPVFAF